MTKLIDGKVPTEHLKNASNPFPSDHPVPTGSTRRAIFFSHERINPMEVPVQDWVLHDGSSLPYGSATVILLYRRTAELLDGHDLAYELMPNPDRQGEISIKKIYLCPVGTLDTLDYDRSSHECVTCKRKASSLCMCQSVAFCSKVCKYEANRRCLHTEDDCLRAYASGLVARAATEKEKAIELGKKRADIVERVEKAKSEMAAKEQQEAAECSTEPTSESEKHE